MSRPAALVTGGAKRIGAAIARTLAAAGFDVAIHFNRSREEAEALAAALAALGARAALVPADLAAPDAAGRVVSEAAAALGPLSVLVNNASLFASDRFGSIAPETFHANLEANLVAPVLLSQAFAAQASGRFPDGEATIVNLIDQRVFKLTPEHFSYTLAKSALLAATRTMAQALAPAIRVNGIGPGPTLPNVADGPEGMAQEAAGVPLGRAVDPREIAEAVLFLVRARAVTGQMLAVDSGQHIGWRTPDIVA